MASSRYRCSAKTWRTPGRLAPALAMFASLAVGCGNGTGKAPPGDSGRPDDTANPGGYVSPDGAVQGNLGFWTSGVGRKVQPTTAPGPGASIALEPTIMMWGAWYEHATGFLYWDTAGWTVDDPWGPAIHFGKTGDGVLLYPGNHDGAMAPIGSPANVTVDGPIPSQRLKMVRQGLQDWALFQLAEQKGFATQARAAVAKVYSQLGGCTYQGCPAPEGGFFWKSDEALVAQVRSEIAALLLP